MPALCRARMTMKLIATELANPPNGALARMKTRRLEQRGRPLRRYAATASPTSVGNGIGMDRPPLPWTVIWPASQSISSKLSATTSPGPQAQPGEQQQDRVVSPAQRRLAITPTQDALYRSWWEEFRQCRPRPIGHGGHAGSQIQRDFSAIPQVAEKGSECCHQQFGSSRAEPMSVTLHKPGDVGSTKRGEVQGLTSKSLGEELINEGYVVLQRRRGQAPFL